MFAVSMCAANVQEGPSAHIAMRCLRLGSYPSRTSKIVTMGMSLDYACKKITCLHLSYVADISVSHLETVHS
jgi:hypothetical protein